MKALGFPMKVIAGLRTTEQQQKLYAQGRTTPGNIVTNADGVKKKSNHQAKADGFGHAADLCFQGPDPFSEKHPWNAYGACAKALGLVWGGDWKVLVDRPHIELK
jgi:peptidoglycan L-alanyl-D-glutamate endopeptidase CwlK